METHELLLTTSEGTVSLWDCNSTNLLQLYKSSGGALSSKTLNLLGNDYILSGNTEKPLVNIWKLDGQDVWNKNNQWIFPGLVKCLVTCPRNTYLLAGIDRKLYIWHLVSGQLCIVIQKNYQNVNCVKFSNCGNYIVSGSQDGMLNTYDLTLLLNGSDPVPIYSKTDHNGAIVDLYVGSFAYKSRVVTISLDQTCKIYKLLTGQLILNLILDEQLSSVLLDANCWYLFIGGTSGVIREFSLKSPPKTLNHHCYDDSVKCFNGHQKDVTCLDLNLTKTVLVSGSKDCFVFLWDCKSRQILKRIQHKNTVTNLKFVLNHRNFFSANFKPLIKLVNLDKNLVGNCNFTVSLLQNEDIQLASDDDNDDGNGIKAISNCDNLKILQAENSKLRSINKQLYNAAINISKQYNHF